MPDHDALEGQEWLITRQKLLQLAGAGALALGLPRTAGAQPLATPRRGGRWRVSIASEGIKDVFDPHNVLNDLSLARNLNVYDTLTKWAGFPRLKETPFLASSVTPNRNYTAWQVKLRRGVTFHNDKPLTADDVLYSITRVANQKSGLSVSSFLAPVDAQASKRVGPYEVLVRTKAPTFDLMGRLSYITIVPAGATQFDPPIGTGPFKLGSWELDKGGSLVRNDSYWLSGMPYLDEVQIILLADKQAQINALLGGQIDAVGGLSPVQARTLERNRAVKIFETAPGVRLHQFVMRMDTRPYSDVNVRQALRLAVDREQLVKIVLLGHGVVGNDLQGRGYSDYNGSLPQRQYDPERAKSMLKRAGFENLTVTLQTGVAEVHTAAATAYKQQAKRAGINIKLKVVPPDQYYARWPKGFPFYQGNSGAGFSDYAPFNLYCKGIYNDTRWCDPAWEREFKKSIATLDPAKRLAALKRLQVPLWERGGYIVWGYPNVIDVASAKTQGLVKNVRTSFNGYDFKRIWLS